MTRTAKAELIMTPSILKHLKTARAALSWNNKRQTNFADKLLEKIIVPYGFGITYCYISTHNPVNAQYHISYMVLSQNIHQTIPDIKA